jgi:hypothetical protein
MSRKLGDSTTQSALPHKDHPIQAFFLNRAHEALRIGIQIGERLNLSVPRLAIDAN